MMREERLMDIIQAQVTSEKSYNIADQFNQFVFRVARDANKFEIKDAIEMLFNVKVKSVRVCNMPGKVRNFGRFSGRTKRYKKAYVALQDGYDIDFKAHEGK